MRSTTAARALAFLTATSLSLVARPVRAEGELDARAPAAPAIAPPHGPGGLVLASASFVDPGAARPSRRARPAGLAALEAAALAPARTVEPAATPAMRALQIRELDRLFGAGAPEVAYALAHTLAARGRTREAISLHEELLRRWPSSRWSSPARYALALRAEARGDTAEAARHFLDAARAPAAENPLYALAWYHLAELAAARRDAMAASVAKAKLSTYVREHGDRADARVLGPWLDLREVW